MADSPYQEGGERLPLPNRPVCEFCGNDFAYTIDGGLHREHRELYRACPNCHIGLVMVSLAPWQFLRAKGLGGEVERFYLHSDFYDYETGEALQPKAEGLSWTAPWGPAKDEGWTDASKR